MKHLILLRHAKSSRDEHDLADHDRPLSQRGKRDAKLLGWICAEKNLQPEYIYCSTSRRTKETLKKIQKSCHRAEDIISYIDRIYEMSVQSLSLYIQSLDDTYETVMIIGHNPSIEEFAKYIGAEIAEVTTGGMLECWFAVEQWRDIQPEKCAKTDYISPKVVREWMEKV